MSKKLKVYGGCFDGLTRKIVATNSMRHAGELFGVSAYAMSGWCSETGNDVELDVALASPYTVFQISSKHLGKPVAADYVIASKAKEVSR